MFKIILSILAVSNFAFAIDFAKLEKELTNDGAVGWIHGAVNDRNLFVFTYRNPEKFFDYAHISVITSDAEVRTQLSKVGRHDKVRLFGKFAENPSPQKHIELSKIEIVEEYEPVQKSDPYKHEAVIPDDLKGQTRATFLVHAIAEGGKILVVEYKDAVLPVVLRNFNLTKDLQKNDIIEMSYTLQGHPDAPTHLRLNERAPEAVKVIEAIKDINEKEVVDVEGALILFQKSPDIKINVFAVEETKHGLKRQYTLVNTEDFEGQLKILQAEWDKFPGEYDNGRNKLVSRKIRVRVKNGRGAVYNQVSAAQANPQIFLKDLESLEFIEEK